LHLVATPIGNAGDLSPRALAALLDARYERHGDEVVLSP
jgi:16S rRNA C1402 (ribose-2'-O) methylase RsmI